MRNVGPGLSVLEGRSGPVLASSPYTRDEKDNTAVLSFDTVYMLQQCRQWPAVLSLIPYA